jgi:hypothetical protein
MDAARHTIGIRAGDVVEVRSKEEILSTLGEEGALDGLPFMPEMASFCGRRFRVTARTEKTCVEDGPGSYPVREFLNNDVVFLNGLRCSGAAHDGCGRLCLLFWKEAWIRKVESEPDGETTVREEVSGEEFGLRTKLDAGGYICQSSCLLDATQPMSQHRKIIKCWHEVRSGTRGPLEMGWLMLRSIVAKWIRRFWSNTPAGPREKTPTEALNLQPGDWVEVKPMGEILTTLDPQGRNRGLQMDKLLKRYCGNRYKVRKRLDRMITESTGHMRRVRNTVILEGPSCRCWFVLGGCARREPVYWREIWLKKVPGPDV